MITIFFTRHGKSCRNLYDENGKPEIKNVNDYTFRDTPLCADGLEEIIYKRKAKMQFVEALGPVDCTIVSPMKRCLETALCTYQIYPLRQMYPIYVMSLVQEYGSAPDCLGKPMGEICTDPVILSYRHYTELDFTYFMEGFFGSETAPTKTDMSAMKWTILSYRTNYFRTQRFFEFIAARFTAGQRIHVFTHGNFIHSVVGVIPKNYETVEVHFMPVTGEINWRVMPV